MINLIHQFLSTPERNAWLYSADMQLYIRKSKRVINSQIVTTLDIANITVYHKGQGIFKKFIKEFHEINPYQASYIESILEPRLVSWCQRNGWTQLLNVQPPSF